MTEHALYAIRRGPHGYTLSKFDTNLNFLAEYSTDAKHCSCPAGPRPTCRHRKMLPRMLGKVGLPEFYCYETNTWHRPLPAELETDSPAAKPPTIAKHIELDDNANVAEEFSKLLAAGGSQGEAKSLVQAASEMLAIPPSPEAAVMYTNTELAPPVALAPAPTGIRRR